LSNLLAVIVAAAVGGPTNNDQVGGIKTGYFSGIERAPVAVAYTDEM